MKRLLLLCFGTAMTMMAFIAAAPSALACACCAETAWRYVQIEGLSGKRTAEMDLMRFAKPAKLMASAKEEDRRIKGVADPADNYQVEMTRAKYGMTFSFQDEKGRTGTIAFPLPNTISIFEVDPRGAEIDKGLGPTLYKEWKVTAHATGDGLFKAAVTRNTKITLVLHGRGNACTSADQFTDWTLQVYGPPGKFTLFGKLDSAAQ
jgi:hypothetical protein